MKKWVVSKPNKENAQIILNMIKDNIPNANMLAMLLDLKGFKSKEEIFSFLSYKNKLHNPFLMKDMEKAVKRIQNAIENNEKICIYGDYDADGVTSTVLLYSYLQSCGANVMYYIPSRDSEGYGMNKYAVEKLYIKKVNLIITVDNGISAFDEIDLANSFGIDVIVTDHHTPQENYPNAFAILNPHRWDCSYPYKNLCGVGVVFKLVCALENDEENIIENYSDLVAIGTISDIVELSGENRTLVKYGLKAIQNTERYGLIELMKIAGIEQSTITSTNVAFGISPRINACGRIESVYTAVELLLAETPNEAEKIAKKINDNNKQRQALEQKIFNDIELIFSRKPHILQQPIIVVAGEGWHHGVIGIVSSRITEKYGKPSIIMSVEGNAARGSGRSVEGFSLCDAIFANSEYLIKYGGHPMAVGFSIAAENIKAFSKSIIDYVKNQDEMPISTLMLSFKLNPSVLNVNMVDSIKYMEPYGCGNDSPIFGIYSMKIDNITAIGGGKHLRLTLSKDKKSYTAIKWGAAIETFPYVLGDIVDLAVTISKTEYSGTEQISIIIKDMKLSACDNEYIITEKRKYEEYKRGDNLTQEQIKCLYPSREEFADIYRFIKKNNGWKSTISRMQIVLNKNITYSKILIILDIMQELSLIDIIDIGGIKRITLLQVEKKVDLESSEILRDIIERGCVK